MTSTPAVSTSCPTVSMTLFVDTACSSLPGCAHSPPPRHCPFRCRLSRRPVPPRAARAAPRRCSQAMLRAGVDTRGFGGRRRDDTDLPHCQYRTDDFSLVLLERRHRLSPSLSALWCHHLKPTWENPKRTLASSS